MRCQGKPSARALNCAALIGNRGDSRASPHANLPVFTRVRQFIVDFPYLAGTGSI